MINQEYKCLLTIKSYSPINISVNYGDESYQKINNTTSQTINLFHVYKEMRNYTIIAISDDGDLNYNFSFYGKMALKLFNLII